MARVRSLVIVLGDQLDHQSAAFDDFSVSEDVVWMAEVAGESKHVFSHKARIAFFLAAMRHFAAELRDKKVRLEYRELDAPDNKGQLKLELAEALRRLKPQKVVVVEPGELRVQEMVKRTVGAANLPLDMRPDRHFLCSREDFAAWAQKHKQLRLEFFYRDLRKKLGVLMEKGQPVGGQWNFDAENRKSFGRNGPGLLPEALSFKPDAITREVLELVERTFPDHPGSLQHFAFPVTAAQAREALRDFVEHRLARFGDFQDAMWTDQPFLFHSRISGAMNVKLIDPRAVLMAVEDAYQRGLAPLAAVEGFVRQIIGWREYVRGVYWTYMPKYVRGNALNAHEDLPDFFWTGDTDMECLRQSIGQTLAYGYAHHIQRLMVTGLFSMLFGVKPVEIHKWYLAIYWDAVEWVELPNVIGLSQFADGGLMGSKPYAASGRYISRMSNYCQHCRYKPDKAVGDDACPFTTLYWDFVMKHKELLSQNMRTRFQVRNMERFSEEHKNEIRERAVEIRAKTAKGSY